MHCEPLPLQAVTAVADFVPLDKVAVAVAPATAPEADAADTDNGMQISRITASIAPIIC